jgi:hypothetical protein
MNKVETFPGIFFWAFNFSDQAINNPIIEQNRARIRWVCFKRRLRREKWKRREILSSKFERKKEILLKSGGVCALLSNFSDNRKMIKIKKWVFFFFLKKEMVSNCVATNLD